MNSLYFEQYIQNNKIPTKELINLSQCQRMFNKHNTVDYAESYLIQLKNIIQVLRYNRIPIQKHPQFENEGFQSTNWNFELIRVSSIYKNLLIDKYNEEEDLKIKNKLLLRAIKLSNDCSRISASILFHNADNRLFKMLNPQYHLSETMKLAALRFFNTYKFKPNYLAIKKAFQLQEIATILWKQDEETLNVAKYKSKALLELANKMDDNQCGEKIALLQKIVLQEGCTPDVKSQYEIWKQQNDSVYYQMIQTDKKIDVISLEEAFGILSKCLVSPSK